MYSLLLYYFISSFFLFYYSKLFILFFFFFSSRGRHTRWNCDWSSDVCSSDLERHHDGHDEDDRRRRMQEHAEEQEQHVQKCQHEVLVLREVRHRLREVLRRLHFGQVRAEIGRASCRERVEMPVVAVASLGFCR